MDYDRMLKSIIGLSVIVFIFAIIGLTAHFTINTAVNSMIDIPQVNSSNVTVQALNDSADIADRYDYLGFGLFIALILGYLILGYFSGQHPIFIFLYFIVTIISIILSTILSNTWDTVSSASVFGSTVVAFPIVNHIILYSPIYVPVISFAGLVLMFIRTQQGDR